MTNYQVRQAGTLGLKKDMQTFELPPAAWSDCLNVRFNADTASLAGSWKSAVGLGTIDPALVSAWHISGQIKDTLIAADGTTGTIYEVDYNKAPTPIGSIGTPAGNEWTSTVLADVLYVNLAGFQPLYRLPSSAGMTALPNMGGKWTCRALRAYKDYLVAINITPETGSPLDNTVYWSDATLAGQIPTSWNQSQNVSSLGGANTLAQMKSALVDGAPLGEAFILYGQNEVWSMTFTGDGAYPFTFRRLFGSGGLKRVNCVIEAHGCHYVFGWRDIYRHDGNTMESLSAGTINQWFWTYEFREMTDNPAFVSYNEANNEVMFHYQSRSAPNGYKGCDRALVWNTVSNTWSIYSAPNVSSAALGNITSAQVWDALVGSWDKLGRTWDDMFDASYPIPFYGSRKGGAVTQGRIVAFDQPDGPIAGSILDELNEQPFLERQGICFDSVFATGSPVNQALEGRQIYPLIQGTGIYTVRAGGSYAPYGNITWESSCQFDPTKDYRCDIRVNGRFLAVRFEFPYAQPWGLNGYDYLYSDGGSS